MPGRLGPSRQFPGCRAPAVLAVLLVVQALMPSLATMGVTGDGTRFSGEVLVVDDTYRVTGSESWEQVQVWTEGRLIIEADSTLISGSVSLNGALEIRGGSLILGGPFERGPRTLTGDCRELTMSPGSAISVIGGAGSNTIDGSSGEGTSIHLTASQRIRIESSSIWLDGGDGHSPSRPYNDGDLDGVASAGGPSTVHLAVRSTGAALEIIDSQIVVEGGGGGDAPSGTSSHGGTGGRGGGFTEGGRVSGDVARGGDGSVYLVAPIIDLNGTSIHVSGGDGGDAGDGGAVEHDATAGGGGGGYSGGPGADADALYAQAGGGVSGRVGGGGHAKVIIDGGDCIHRGTEILVLGGRGGDAGDGGDSRGEGGGGGGGYSGGGGGSPPSADGAKGGGVGLAVGKGGDASIRYDLSGTLAAVSSLVQVTGGNGGDAGDGGSVVGAPRPAALGGGGGGGYSGGGGGAAGRMVDNSTLDRGTDGGDGGSITHEAGMGGEASIRLAAQDARLDGSDLSATGGGGGSGGAPGSSLWIGEVRNETAGGGGGSYSGGGGAGSNGVKDSGGTGGESGGARGNAGDGGDASLVLEPENATVLLSNRFTTERGPRGRCQVSPTLGPLSGRGEGRLTSRGMEETYIPRSRGAPLLPVNGTVDSMLPTFTWAPIHPSTDGGRVVGFDLMVDDDEDFSSPEWTVIVPTHHYDAIWVPNFTFYWRVAPRYTNPPNLRGMWSESRVFEYLNLPPVVSSIPPVAVSMTTVTEIDLSPFIDDPDDPDDRLELRCKDPHRVRVKDLNVSVYFDEETTGYAVPFTVTDGLSSVDGELIVQVLRYHHPPYLRGLEGIRPPIDLVVEEGTSEWYNILVHDVDSTEFRYSTSGWPGVIGHENGTLQVVAVKGEVGAFESVLTVADESGQTAEMGISVVVRNVNDPPSTPVVASPTNGSSIEEGRLLRFVVTVEDADVPFGQMLNVSFISNSSGVLKTIQTDGVASFSYSGLPPGEHRISVSASDGRYSSHTWLLITVEEPPEPSYVEIPQREVLDPTIFLMAAVALFALAYGLGRLSRR